MNAPITIGIDEVNYSPSFAGDCVVCALWLPDKPRIEGVTDSKQTSLKQRLAVFAKIQELGLYSIVPATVASIRVLGIYKARNLAIEQAAMSLMGLLHEAGFEGPLHILIDGPSLPINFIIGKAEYIVGGDESIYVVSAASIVAKVYVDALFEGWNTFWPGYSLNSNHGASSREMVRKLKVSGPTPIHRRNGYAKAWWDKLELYPDE